MMWKCWALVVAMVGFTAGASFAIDGEAVYKEKCVKCHGETGKGDTPTGKSMKVASLVGDAKVLGGSIAELIKGIRENKKHKEPVKKLGDEELQAVVTVIRRLAAGQ